MPELVLPSRKIARYGFRPSLRRQDEFVANASGLKVKPEVDPRDVINKLRVNQWALGSCTANATTNAFRYDSIIDGHDCGQLCRFQTYWGERQIEGTLGQGDTGAEGHDAFTVARHSGIVAETVWPYDWPGMTNDQPPDDGVFDPAKLPQAVVGAKPAYKLTKQVAAVPQQLQQVKAVLSNRQTIAFGFTVYESFESGEVASSGIVPMPQQGEQIVGGHEVLLVGYLKSEPHYGLVLNSWGEQWGEAGYFLLPWTYLLSHSLTSDLRTIVRPVGK